MPKTNKVEQWACAILQKQLNQPVALHDDNSAPGMYDLRIGTPDAPEIAIECIGAVNQRFTETWNMGPAKGPLELSLKGDWNITITAKAPLNTIKKRIEPILQELERRAIRDVHVDYRLWSDPVLFNTLDALHITHLSCFRIEGAGKVYFGMPGSGGAVDSHGSSVSAWIGTFLRDPARQDVLSKLERSGAPSRHVFVVVSFDGAPWPVTSYFLDESELLPSQAPDLPPPVTGVWIVAGSGKGLYWNGSAWHLFRIQNENTKG